MVTYLALKKNNIWVYGVGDTGAHAPSDLSCLIKQLNCQDDTDRSRGMLRKAENRKSIELCIMIMALDCRKKSLSAVKKMLTFPIYRRGS